MTTMTTDKPNGPVAAVLLASGIGAAVLGLGTLIYEINDTSAFANAMKWYKPVGGLSGKSTTAILAFFLSWLILYFVWRGKDTNFTRIATIAFVLLILGLIGTFPPVWHLFSGG